MTDAPQPDLRRRATVLGLAGLLAACAGAPPEPEHAFRPELGPPAARPRPALRLVVEPFRVQGLYADRALVIRDAAGRYRQAIGRSWVGPPSLLLGEVLVDHLRAAYGDSTVFTPQARIDGSLTLRPALLRFERVQDPAGDRAVLKLEFVLTARDGSLLGHQVFDQSADTGPGPEAYVAAQSRLLEAAATRLLGLLDAVLTPAP